MVVVAVRKEGTPKYIGVRLILFHGDTAHKGNFTASETPSSAGNCEHKSIIRLTLSNSGPPMMFLSNSSCEFMLKQLTEMGESKFVSLAFLLVCSLL
ncbi:hypothetical protein JHK87_003723 [Glycine soja]|nr:hypothetical protein JHK87_003723 [Glycine soja]